MNRADRWLHGQLRAIGRWRDGDWRAIGGGGIDSRDDLVAQRLEGALAGLEALEVAGAVSAASASRWRVVFAREAGGERGVVAGPGVGARAERFLADLLDTLPPGVEGDVADVLRFEAAVKVFSAVGAVDSGEWYARLGERRSGEEERAEELGGTEAELIEVIPGPGEVRRGHRLLLVLRFADGVSLMVDKRMEETVDDDWGWELTDDVGTSYRWSGGGGGGETEYVSFGTRIPAEATWIQLSLDGQADVSFRVSL